MKITTLLIGFIFWTSTFSFAQVEKSGKNNTERLRTPLIEVFTSSTCPPCNGSNVNLHNVLNQYTGRYAMLKYQVNWPGNGDPYYTAEGGIRTTSYYGVNSVPSQRLDGNNTTVSLNGLNNAQNIPAFIELEVDYILDGKSVYAIAKATSTIDITGENLRLYMAIVETETHNNWQTSPNQSNGERVFYQVMKKFMPDAQGIVIGNMTAGNTFVSVQEWEFKGNYRKPNNASNPINHNIEHSVEDFDNLVVVAWIQNYQNKSIKQACNGVEVEEGYVSYGDGANGSVSATVNGEPIEPGAVLEIGDLITFTADPDEGYEVAEWIVNGKPVTKSKSNEITLEYEGNFLFVTASFQVTHFKVTFGIHNNVGNGTLVAFVDEEEIASDDMVYRNSQIVFTAIPDEGYEVMRWRLNGTPVTGNMTTQYVVPSFNGNINVTVEFQTTHIMLQYSSDNDCGILVAKIDNEVVESGELVPRRKRVVFTVTLDPCCEILRWRSNGVVIYQYTNPTYTIQAINRDENITVELMSNQFPVIYSVINDFGSLDAFIAEEEIGSGECIEPESKVVFIATPDEGYLIKEWIYNGEIVPDHTSEEFVIESLYKKAIVTVEFIEDVGIKEHAFSKVRVYPNPFKDEIFIESEFSVANIEIVNVLGQTVKKGKFDGKPINTTNLSSGVYFVIIEGFEGDKTVRKMVK